MAFMEHPLIELRHLRALNAIARQRSLSAASRDLHCTPSALSHLLADLERLVRQPLVLRDRRPLALTAAGRRVADCAELVLPAIARTRDDLERLRNGSAGRLLISLECHSCFEWLVPTLDSFRLRHPEVELDLRSGASFDPYPALRDGVVDVVISCDGSGEADLFADPLFAYEVVAVLPPRHPLTAKRRLAAEDFAELTIITYPVDEGRLDLYARLLMPAGICPRRRRTAEMTAMLIQLVASGHGVAALPHWAVAAAAAAGSVALRPLGRGLWSELAILRRKRDAGDRGIDRFVATARQVSFATLSGIRPARGRPMPSQAPAPATAGARRTRVQR
jgi:LysR family transcriptional regulator for metE and metH